MFRFDDAEVGRRFGAGAPILAGIGGEFPRALLTGSGAAAEQTLLVGKREVAEVTTLIMGPAEGGDGSSNGDSSSSSSSSGGGGGGGGDNSSNSRGWLAVRIQQGSSRVWRGRSHFGYRCAPRHQSHDSNTWSKVAVSTEDIKCEISLTTRDDPATVHFVPKNVTKFID